MSAETRQKQEIAEKAKAVRDLSAKIEEQTKARRQEGDAVRKHVAEMAAYQKRFTWCTVVFFTILLLSLAVISLVLFSTSQALAQLQAEHATVLSSMEEFNTRMADSKQALNEQQEQLMDVGKKYYHLLEHHNSLFAEVNKLSHESLVKIKQDLNANKRSLTQYETNFDGFRTELEKLAKHTSLNAELLSALNKTVREMNGTFEKMQHENNGVLSRCCNRLDSKLKNINDTLQENTEIVHAEQEKVNSLTLLSTRLESASLEHKETLDMIKSGQGHVNERVAHLYESITLVNQKLEKLNSESESFQLLLNKRAELADPVRQSEAQLQNLSTEAAVEAGLEYSEESIVGSTNTCIGQSECQNKESKEESAQPQNLGTEMRTVEDTSENLEKSIVGSTNTCSGESECQNKESKEESVSHDSSEL